MAARVVKATVKSNLLLDGDDDDDVASAVVEPGSSSRGDKANLVVDDDVDVAAGEGVAEGVAAADTTAVSLVVIARFPLSRFGKLFLFLLRKLVNEEAVPRGRTTAQLLPTNNTTRRRRRSLRLGSRNNARILDMMMLRRRGWLYHYFLGWEKSDD